MKIRPLARRALKSSPITVLAVLACSGSVGAATPNEIEGVWSFGGGAVVIQRLSDGTFQGTVVSPTTFVSCQHPAGEVLWTNMRAQPDGSFWGLHQWYHGASCEVLTQLGETAWRVIKNPDGSRYLKVCFSNPGSSSQPTIAADLKGTPAKDTYGCAESIPLAPVPVTEGGGGPGSSGTITFSQAVTLPKATACVSQTSLKIALKDPKYDPLKEVVVKLNGKQVADVKGTKRIKKGITLKKLPSGTYKVGVLATTVLNQHLSGSQTYKSCTKGSGKIKLHGGKSRHA